MSTFRDVNMSIVNMLRVLLNWGKRTENVRKCDKAQCSGEKCNMTMLEDKCISVATVACMKLSLYAYSQFLVSP